MASLGIRSYGAYIPKWRLGKESKGWRYPVERSVASYDEDAVTMAVAAVLDCLAGFDRQAVDAILFCSSSSPFDEKQVAALVATACDFRRNILSVDITGSTRSGTIGLKIAADLVKSGEARNVVVVASDMRMAQPRSEFEYTIGDGAAAFIVGEGEAIAEIEDFYTVADEIYDVWKMTDEKYIQSWEDRFTLDEGYFPVLGEVAAGILKKRKLEAKDFSKAVYYGPNLRRHLEMGRRLKLDQAQIESTLFNGVGNTGTAFVPMSMVAALENSKPGDRLLIANYGNGADAFIMTVTENITKLPMRRGIKKHLNSKMYIKDYDTYLYWRGFLDFAPLARRPELQEPSAAALWRERDKNLKLYGSRCQSCGYPQFPPQIVCSRCSTKGRMEPYRFSDKRATLFTYSADSLAPTKDPPLVISVINFEGGGRMVCTMTDRKIDEIKIGMPLELTFRLLDRAGSILNYYWKCMPLRS